MRKGSKLTDEHRNKIRKSLLGRQLSLEHRQHISSGGKAKRRSEHTKLRISAAAKKRGRLYYQQLAKKAWNTKRCRYGKSGMPAEVRRSATQKMMEKRIQKYGFLFSPENRVANGHAAWKTRRKRYPNGEDISSSKMGTIIEQEMAYLLDCIQVKFNPQFSLCGLLVDFYLPEYRLVIECDGCLWHNCPVCKPKQNWDCGRTHKATKTFGAKIRKVDGYR